MSQIMIPDRLIRNGLTAAYDHCYSDEGRQVMEQSATHAAAGDVRAYYAPAVMATIDATLSAVGDESIEPLLSREVVSRRSTATTLADHLTNLCIASNFYFELYRVSPLSDVRLSRNDLFSLYDKNYMSLLAQAPFSDAQAVSGGAVKLLENSGLERPSFQGIITQSGGLLAISGIHKAHQSAAAQYLGSPYANPKLLQFKTGADQRVEFTPTARQQLRNWMAPQGGCPAGKLETVSGTLLAQYWDKIVSFLITEDVTVEASECDLGS